MTHPKLDVNPIFRLSGLCSLLHNPYMLWASKVNSGEHGLAATL